MRFTVRVFIYMHNKNNCVHEGSLSIFNVSALGRDTHVLFLTTSSARSESISRMNVCIIHLYKNMNVYTCLQLTGVDISRSKECRRHRVSLRYRFPMYQCWNINQLPFWPQHVRFFFDKKKDVVLIFVTVTLCLRHDSPIAICCADGTLIHFSPQSSSVEYLLLLPRSVLVTASCVLTYTLHSHHHTILLRPSKH